MPDNENQTPQSGETPKSLREIAEAAYDDIAEGQPDEAEAPSEVDTQDRQRDEYGRFVKAEPGEAEAPEPPSPDEKIAAPQTDPTQPREGEAAGAPANWSEADRQQFAKLPQDAQSFLLRRHSEMEGDYQRRVQTNAQAAQFAQGLAPVFNDQRIAQSLQQWGMTPQDAVNQWAGFHLQAIDPNPVNRAGFILDLAARIGVPLNPAALGQPSPLQGLPAEVQKDPAIKFFADYLGKVSTQVQATQARQDRMEQASQQQQEAEALRVTKWGIDSFADQKDDRGNLVHPFFDEVIEQVQELYKANPQRNLNEAYDTACRMNRTVWAKVQQHEAAIAAKKAADQRAAQAARLNVRGRTGPVTNGAAPDRPKTLRDTIEAAADDLGF